MATAVNECNSFTCPICLEELKFPKSLPCLHSFCEICIGEFILSTERRAGQKLSSYHCPVCRSVVTPTNPELKTSQWASSLPQTFKISAPQALIDQSEITKQECHLCKTENIRNIATHWCRDCSEAFCDVCLRIHNRMKISTDHKVVKIEEKSNCTSGGESELSLISDTCSVHDSKILEAFCFDHHELCCLLCLTAQHRKCENVQAFEEMKNLNMDGIQSFESELKEVKVKVEQLIKEKKSKYVKLDSSFKDIELAAKTSATSIKDRVDILLASFLKELYISRDEQKTVFEGKLKTAKNLLSRVVALTKTTQSVRDYGTLNQMFIHLQKSKHELKSKIDETSNILNLESVVEARFAINKALHQVEKAGSFGKIDVFLNIPIHLNELMNVNPLDTGTIRSIKLRHKKTMYFEFDVYAICMMDTIILVGGDLSIGKLNAIDFVTDTCLAKSNFKVGIKRLACDIESLTIFISCFNSNIYTWKLHEREFKLPKEIKSVGVCNDGLCIFDRCMYIIVERELKMLKIDNQEIGLQKCFNTKTKCFNRLNGLGTDVKNKRLLYTSDSSEVVATTTDGSEIFCYKDPYMKRIVSVAVNNQGYIVACDQSSALHVISEDGKQRKTLLDTFDKIKVPNDICFDKSGKVVFVCGGKFVEVYDFVY